MQTITIDIINSKAIKLLQDLKLLKLIRMHKAQPETGNKDFTKYRGAMSKQLNTELIIN